MFSSNQKFEISGPLHGDYLKNAIKFALEYSGNAQSFKKGVSVPAYQIDDSGNYVVGYIYEKLDKEGWNEYPFDYDADIISMIAEQHLKKAKLPSGCLDGSYEDGFLLKSYPETFASEKNGVKKPHLAIFSLEPYKCFYSK